LGKKERYSTELSPLVEASLATGKAEGIEAYLAKGSNLPGARANLELAGAFAEVVGEAGLEQPAEAWDLCVGLARLPAERSRQNTPGEFVAFCGVRGIGALGAVSAKPLGTVMDTLKGPSGDARWRLRESVAASIQSLLATHREEVLRELEGWSRGDEWLRMRAVVAGVAEPPLMKDSRIAEEGLKLHKKVMGRVLHARERSSPEFRALRQALGYSFSVIAVARPRDSFAYLEELVASKDDDAIWIVRENLKKDRLRKNFPKEVAALGRAVEKASGE